MRGPKIEPCGSKSRQKKSQLHWNVINSSWAKTQIFQCKTTGLHISPETPFLAASPGGLVSCSLCGVGLVKVKCPWTNRGKSVTDLANSQSSHLRPASDWDFLTVNYLGNSIQIPSGDSDSVEYKGRIANVNHQYFAKVQCQIYCMSAKYCDLVTMTQALENNISDMDPAFIGAPVRNALVFCENAIISELAQENMRMRYEKCMWQMLWIPCLAMCVRKYLIQNQWLLQLQSFIVLKLGITMTHLPLVQTEMTLSKQHIQH